MFDYQAVRYRCQIAVVSHCRRQKAERKAEERDNRKTYWSRAIIVFGAKLIMQLILRPIFLGDFGRISGLYPLTKSQS